MTNCSACGLAFSSESSFDKHRTGKYTNEHPHYGRRCRTTDELDQLGMVDRAGVWTTPMSDENREKMQKLWDEEAAT